MTLGRALLDAESWLGSYARQVERERLERLVDEVTAASGAKAMFDLNQIQRDSHSDNRDFIHSTHRASQNRNEADSDTTAHDNDDDNMEDVLLRWGYNSSKSIAVIIPTSGLTVRLPHPLRPDCTAALPLLKYVAEHSYRPNDLMKEALELYLEGDVWGAVELYEEAADLGVHSAQENVAFLYGVIADEKCLHLDNRHQVSTGVSKLMPTEWLSAMPWLGQVSEAGRMVFGSRQWHTIKDSPDSVSYRGYSKLVRSRHCQTFFRNMAVRRWIQVANGEEVEALRGVAKMYEGVGDRWKYGSLQPNETRAALLYGHASALYGDISSVMALAGLVQRGSSDGR